MHRQINLKKLWLLASAIWVVVTCLYFYRPLIKEYGQRIEGQELSATLALESEWYECAKKKDLFPSIKFGDECRDTAEKACKSFDYPWHEDCLTREKESCIRSKFPECQYVFDNSAKRYLDTPTWKRKLQQALDFACTSKRLLFAIITLILGPLLLWLLPSLFRRVKNWLYA